MVRTSFVRAVVLIVAVAACGSEPTPPGTLTITVHATSPVVNTATVSLSGEVTRSPSVVDVPIIVSVTAGSTIQTDTAGTTGAWAFDVGLTANAVTNLTVTASDPTGSTVTPVTLQIRHDNQPPGAASFSPVAQADNVTVPQVTVTFTEPIKPGSASFTVRQQGVVVPGSATLSGDSLVLTFVPTAPFAANAVHAIAVAGAEDAVGNAASQISACFVTAGADATGSDASDDWFVTAIPGPPGPNLAVLDLQSLRFSQTATSLYGVLRFTNERSFNAQANNNVFVSIDLDIDGDGATGFTSLKDTVFATDSLLPHSGIGAEYTIRLIPGTSAADSSVIGQYTGPLNGPILGFFLPDVCGPSIGFVVPRTLLGGDDGLFRAVVYSDAFEAAGGGYADPAPDVAFFDVALPPAAPGWGAVSPAPPVVQAGPAARALRQQMTDVIARWWLRGGR